MRSAWKIIFALYFAFMVSFVVFPGAFLDSHLSFMKGLGDQELQWFSITVIAGFNIMDTVGRYLGGKIMAKPRTIYLLSALRTL